MICALHHFKSLTVLNIENNIFILNICVPKKLNQTKDLKNGHKPLAEKTLIWTYHNYGMNELKTSINIIYYFYSRPIIS